MITAALTMLGAGLVGGWTASSLLAAAAEAETPPAGHFVAVPGGRLHYADTAPGDSARPAVVLLHGASSHHSDLFHVFAPRLSAQARVLAFDRPGHGWSDRLRGREMASPTHQAQAVLAALDSLGIKRAVIVAHSLAGAMATSMGLQRPDVVIGLVLIGAVTHPWPRAKITWYYHPAAHPLLGPLFVRSVVTPIGSAILERSAVGVFAPQAMPRDYLESARLGLALRPRSFEANAQDVAGLYAHVSEHAPRYPALTMPVTAIAGEDDTIVWTEVHSVAITREVSQGRLFKLPGVGHMPHHAAPGLITAEISRLL
jgi:pimeloyl-ACP methyl ester carboxylesterase